MRIVAGRAVLAHRRVLEEHRTAHLGVAARAGLGHRAPDLERLDVGDGPVRVVARRCRTSCLRAPACARPRVRSCSPASVARRAQLGFCRFNELVRERGRLVDAMAGRAREVARLVRAALPPCVCAAVVARQTRTIDLGRFHRLELRDLSLGVVVDVRLSRTMTALASELGDRRSPVGGLPVLRALEACFLIGVTQQARVGAGVAAGESRLGRSRGSGPAPGQVPARAPPTAQAQSLPRA